MIKERVIHQVWVGDKPVPEKWTHTWVDKHPNWKYVLWDNEKLKKTKWVNQDIIDEFYSEGKFHGVADVMRYQILYMHGGFVAPADSECLKPIDELMNINEDCFCCYENEIAYPGRLTPMIGATKGNKLMKILTDKLVGKTVLIPWMDTGNHYLTLVVKETKYPIKIYPSWYLLPEHYTGNNYTGNGEPYARQYFGTTLGAYDK